MQFDTTLSLDVIIAIVGIFVAVWRLNRDIDSKISSLREELKADNATLRQEFKADNATLRQEFKADIGTLREDFKADNATLREDLKSLEGKVDSGNQRLARLEGVILSREGLVDSITSADPTA